MEGYAIGMKGLQIHATLRMNHTNKTYSKRNQIQKLYSYASNYIHYKKAGKPKKYKVKK